MRTTIPATVAMTLVLAPVGLPASQAATWQPDTVAAQPCRSAKKAYQRQVKFARKAYVAEVRAAKVAYSRSRKTKLDRRRLVAMKRDSQQAFRAATKRARAVVVAAC